VSGPAIAPIVAAEWLQPNSGLPSVEIRQSRFKTADEVQRYCGVSPVTERSGKQHWVHWRFKSSKFPAKPFVEWATLTIPLSYWASEFYKSQRARRGTHQAALRALAFKWARILFRCWKDRTAYDGSR
jgi:transposase